MLQVSAQAAPTLQLKKKHAQACQHIYIFLCACRCGEYSQWEYTLARRVKKCRKRDIMYRINKDSFSIGRWHQDAP